MGYRCSEAHLAYYVLFWLPCIGKMLLSWKECKKDSQECYWNQGNEDRQDWLELGSIDQRRLKGDLTEVNKIMRAIHYVCSHSLFPTLDEYKTRVNVFVKMGKIQMGAEGYLFSTEGGKY